MIGQSFAKRVVFRSKEKVYRVFKKSTLKDGQRIGRHSKLESSRNSERYAEDAEFVPNNTVLTC